MSRMLLKVNSQSAVDVVALQQDILSCIITSLTSPVLSLNCTPMKHFHVETCVLVCP